MSNRLKLEKSPYLLQHADNPVDWYPWGEEALERAKREDKPLLVSIGYSACHWCHVMERESFEDEGTARLMNENFVNIKVDREERPDVDAIYMTAVQALTGQGGWPLNVFLTPDGKPFYGGTYFPPYPVRGMPSWTQVLSSIAQAYRDRRSDIAHDADVLTSYIERAQQLGGAEEGLTAEILHAASDLALADCDWAHGGFGGAPKFPQPLTLEFLLRMSLRFGDGRASDAVELSLRNMAAGGIFDQLGGGFHRYTVDAVWVVPHFEKMLYDNALLARIYLHAYQATRDPLYRTVVERTLDYLLRDMRSPEGGFYSAEDADSEGVEGKFYVWTRDELDRVLTPDQAEAASLRFGVSPEGNFDGKTILTLALPVATVAERMRRAPDDVERLLAEATTRLLDVRSQRVHPGKDTKILASWNGLAIRALAEAGGVLGRTDYLQAAQRCADFVLDELRPGGHLVRSYRDGPSSIPAFLDDYSYLTEALLTLYETAFNPDYLHQAEGLAAEMIDRFWDEGQNAFFDVSAQTGGLVVRPRSLFDNPVPSGSSAATFAFLRLGALTGRSDFDRYAVSTFRAASDLLARAPLGFSYLLSALDFHLSAQTQIAILGTMGEDGADRLVRTVFDRYLPNAVVAVGPAESSPLLMGRSRQDGRPTAFVCEHFACKLPVTDPAMLGKQLDAIVS